MKNREKIKPSVSKDKESSQRIRLNKFISNSGICSRREADMFISIGNVTVNGKVVTEMGYKVKPDDDVRFDGARINPEQKAYVLLNKPKGFATTTSEGKGRTVMDLVAKATSSKIRPIGRLGRNSLGLILFTNDEKLHAKFTNSKHGVARLFQVTLDSPLQFEHLKQIQEGLSTKGNSFELKPLVMLKALRRMKLELRLKIQAILFYEQFLHISTTTLKKLIVYLLAH